MEYNRENLGKNTLSEGVSTKFAVITIATIFVCSVLALGYVYISFPHLEPEEKKHIKMPWEIEDAKALGRVLARYKERYYFQVLSAIVVTYIFLQTFAIPGSISLSILSGFLFPFPIALLLVCFCSATGASLCYAISHFAGKKMISKYFPERAKRYSALVNKHRSNIFNYMLFLRITPFLPNWFINIAAPVVGVPIFPFWMGTFLGVAPPSFVAIQTGQTLLQLTSTSGTWSWTSVVLLAAFAILSLVPVFLKSTLRSKFD